mgnify:CR=1 FL=1|tara:strand:- start:134544 stop:135581 length:1038 start_codon:yes stop_codon:yes gene_type:complete
MKHSNGRTEKPQTSDRKRAATSPQVSVVIVNFETGDLLSEVVATLFASDTQPLECIVIDNASRDDSIETLRQRVDDPRVKILAMPTNLGFAAGCNQGISHSVGDYVLILNPDCLLQDDVIGQLVSALEENENAGAAGPLILNLDGSEQRGCRRNIPTPWQIFCVGTGLYRLMPQHPRFRSFNQTGSNLPEDNVVVQGISGACMLITRTAIERVGVFDERYFMHFEDLDWCMRAGESGREIVFVPDAVAVHVGGVSGRGRPYRVEAYKHASLIRFVRSNFAQYYPSAFVACVSAIVYMRLCALILRMMVFGRPQHQKGWSSLFLNNDGNDTASDVPGNPDDSTRNE